MGWESDVLNSFFKGHQVGTESYDKQVAQKQQKEDALANLLQKQKDVADQRTYQEGRDKEQRLYQEGRDKAKFNQDKELKKLDITGKQDLVNLKGDLKVKSMSAKDADRLAGFNDTDKQLDKLKESLTVNASRVGPVAGRVGEWNPYDTTGQTLALLSAMVLQSAAKAAEGGKLTDADREFYASVMPTQKDTPESAMEKIQLMRTFNSDKRNSYIGALQNAGFDLGETPSQETPQMPPSLRGLPTKVTGAPQKITEGLQGMIAPKPQGAISKFKTGDIREKNGVKHQRQEDGTWLPVK